MYLTLPICEGKYKQGPKNHQKLQRPARYSGFISPKAKKWQKVPGFQAFNMPKASSLQVKLALASPHRAQSEKTPEAPEI